MDQENFSIRSGQVFIPDSVMEADRIDGCVPAVGIGFIVFGPIYSGFREQ
jgi:hypothetical protein